MDVVLSKARPMEARLALLRSVSAENPAVFSEFLNGILCAHREEADAEADGIAEFTASEFQQGGALEALYDDLNIRCHLDLSQCDTWETLWAKMWDMRVALMSGKFAYPLAETDGVLVWKLPEGCPSTSDIKQVQRWMHYMNGLIANLQTDGSGPMYAVDAPDGSYQRRLLEKMGVCFNLDRYKATKEPLERAEQAQRDFGRKKSKSAKRDAVGSNALAILEAKREAMRRARGAAERG